MADSAPSKISNLKEILATVSLAFQAQREIADILSDHEERLYALSEDNRRLLATVRSHEEKYRSLEKRYAEVLYKLSDLK